MILAVIVALQLVVTPGLHPSFAGHLASLNGLDGVFTPGGRQMSTPFVTDLDHHPIALEYLPL
jgi:hypothetical protein